MKVSRNWLQTFFDPPAGGQARLPSAEELSNALMFHAFEIDGIEHIAHPTADVVLDVKVTPNRGHDCLSHYGIAKELSAILKLPLKRTDPFIEHYFDDGVDAGGELSVRVDTPLCRRYIAGHITGVKVGPSPEWLRASLEAIGQRSINNVVDATNFVMFNIGQPLHAFDAKRLGSLAIGVRLGKEGERLEALDKKSYELQPSMLVITADDRPVGIAGIKGGEADRIDESTTDILIESANFDGATIRRASQALKLRTDASSRFEQALSPHVAKAGFSHALEIIRQLAGGELVGRVDVYPDPQPQKTVSVSLENINALLGSHLREADVSDAFSRLGFPFSLAGHTWEAQVPFERLDIEIAEDLVEEVGRIVGYEHIPATPLPPFDKEPEINKNLCAAEKARQEWTDKGYSEVYTSVFAERGERVVLNKADGVRPYLRDSLIHGLTEALAKNKPNKDLLGLKEIKLFEIGTVWKGGKEQVMIGTITEKEPATEMLLVGPENPTAYDDLPASVAERYRPYSKYPYIVRDIAAWVPAGTTERQAQELIKTEAGELLQKLYLFDVFEKGGRTSIAFRLIFQSFDRTLTEEEANEIMAHISRILGDKGFEIR